MITEERSKKILNEVMESELFPSPIQPHEFTMRQLMSDYNKSKAQMERVLKLWLDRELITKRKASSPNGTIIAYSFTEKATPEELTRP